MNVARKEAKTFWQNGNNHHVAIRSLGLYRNSANRSISSMIEHELNHTRKERSAMAGLYDLSRQEPLSVMKDWSDLFQIRLALVYSHKRVVKSYVELGDVWTVRVPTNPLAVQRTRLCCDSSTYDEVIVTGKPFAIAYMPSVLSDGEIRQIRYLAKKYNLKQIVLKRTTF